MLQHLEIDVTDDDQFLQINGQPVFPPPETLIPMALEAEQIRSSDGAHTEPLRLGYALEILPSISEVTDVVLTPIQLTILDIQGVSVEVDTLKIDLIQTWGQIHIAGIDTIPYSQSPGVDQCTNSICRLRAITADRLRRIIDAARARASQAKSWVKNGCPGMKHAHPGAEEHHTEWHHPHTHHRQGHFRQFVDQTVHLFILPALLGIAGGLVACALGMLVGHALARCMISRSGREGRRLEPENLEAAVERDEKDALMDSGEMPPEYEDVEVVVVEEK